MKKDKETKRQERADTERNREKIREEMLKYIKQNGKAPTITELAELSGFSFKVVSQHIKKIKFQPNKNSFRLLTNNVIKGIYDRAVGFEYLEETFEKLDNKENLEVTGAGELIVGDTYKKKIVTKRVLPDPTAAKLFLQVMEGFTEKQQTEHTGAVGFNFSLKVPDGFKDEAEKTEEV